MACCLQVKIGYKYMKTTREFEVVIGSLWFIVLGTKRKRLRGRWGWDQPSGREGSNFLKTFKRNSFLKASIAMGTPVEPCRTRSRLIRTDFVFFFC